MVTNCCQAVKPLQCLSDWLLFTSFSNPDLDTNASNCPSNVLYLFMSVIPFVILVYVVVKSYHELQTFKSAFLFWTGVFRSIVLFLRSSFERKNPPI